MDSECDGTMKPYKEKNHTNPDPINIICSISLIHFFYSIIIANDKGEAAGTHPKMKQHAFVIGSDQANSLILK
jgi:hypothetical protein